MSRKFPKTPENKFAGVQKHFWMLVSKLAACVDTQLPGEAQFRNEYPKASLLDFIF
jgi:hypothetical protein